MESYCGAAQWAAEGREQLQGEALTHTQETNMQVELAGTGGTGGSGGSGGTGGTGGGAGFSSSSCLTGVWITEQTSKLPAMRSQIHEDMALVQSGPLFVGWFVGI